MKEIESWGFRLGNRPYVIAGPCSAESREQVLASLLPLKGHDIFAFRAGIWKPRTRPGTFAGMGNASLLWLAEASRETGIPCMVEVAGPKHVEDALKAGIDMLWIGARTTVNPFLVQEIADALTGTDIPVLIKNPVNPDIELWIGAIERIMRAGINRIAGIHRGFSSYENSVYRNKPNWEIAIELRRRMPDLPLFCDPSHICGNTYMIPHVAQFALDLQFEGLMLEVHADPTKALSDKDQQLTPEGLFSLLSDLEVRKAVADSPLELSRLEDMRDQIDEIDFELIQLLADRMDIARQIGHFKWLHNVAVLQPERWAEIVKTRTELGVSRKLTMEFILKLYNIIHEESIIQQTGEMKEMKEESKQSVAQKKS